MADANELIIWTTAITGMTTLAAGVVGAALANRHSRRLHELDLAEGHRTDQRAAVAALIDAGDSWVRQLETLTIGIAHLDDPTTFDMSDIKEANARLGTAVSVGVLTITHPSLRPHVEAIAAALRRNDKLADVVQARFAGLPAAPARDRALIYVDNVKAQIRALEAAALRVIASIEPTGEPAATIDPPDRA